VVEVEPLVLPAGTDARVGRKPTASADVGVDVDMTDRWGKEGGTPYANWGSTTR
jgi:hypothetical protein